MWSPDEAVLADMVGRLAVMDDLSCYPFAEQDFLNEFCQGRWRALPSVCKTLKTLQHQHQHQHQHLSVWDPASVKNIHYIIDTSWEKPLDPTDRYVEVNRLWWKTADTLASLSGPDTGQGCPMNHVPGSNAPGSPAETCTP
jgi:lipopolysaccharide biosynthesis glycosyltransferase